MTTKLSLLTVDLKISGMALEIEKVRRVKYGGQLPLFNMNQNKSTSHY